MLGFVKVKLKGSGHQQKILNFIATFSSYYFTFIKSMIIQKRRKDFFSPIQFMILKFQTTH